MKELREVAEHIQHDTVEEYAFYPEHEGRKESHEFKESKKRLKEDGYYKCWICDSTEKLESHHILEWAFSNDIDLQKAQEMLKILDFYGYSNSNEFQDKSIESLDDVRNQLILCEKHHRHKLCGIHHITFPFFISQKCTKEGVQTIPQSEDELKDEIKKLEDDSMKGR
jgi:hypothetical protein